MSQSLSVVPAYGRDYKSLKAAQDDWDAGKDFVVSDVSSPFHGRYVSRRDVEGSELEIWVRYNRATKKARLCGSIER